MTLPSGLSAIVARLAAGLGAQQIVLFGSHAKGTARECSDIDLLIVAHFSGDPVHNLRRARQLVAGHFPRIDIVLCTPEELEGASAGRAPFFRSAIESGVTVYRAPAWPPRERLNADRR